MREGFLGGSVSKKSACSEGDSGWDDPDKPGGRLVEHRHRLDQRLTGYVGLGMLCVSPRLFLHWNNKETKAHDH